MGIAKREMVHLEWPINHQKGVFIRHLVAFTTEFRLDILYLEWPIKHQKGVFIHE